MRIAIYHDLPSGGAKRTLYETVKRLSRQHGLDVYTLSTSDKDFCSLSAHVNAEYVYQFLPSQLFRSPFGRLNQLVRWGDLRRLDRLSRQIAKDIDSRKYDVVFAQPCIWTQAPLVLRYLRTPTVYYLHEPPRHLYEDVGQGRNMSVGLQSKIDAVDPLIWLYRSAARRFDQAAVHAAKLVLVNSRFIQSQSKSIYGIDTVICYHGVDTDAFMPQPQIERAGYVLSVGAIQPHKGYDFLIESFSFIDKQIRPVLHLVGNMNNSSYEDALRAMALKNRVDLLIEVGVDQAALVRKYNEAALVAYAPYNEPFGLVPLEAMACGKPVVGVCEGGVKETVVDNYTGTLVNRDPKVFGAAIQSVLENPSLMARYSENSRKHVLENWSWEKSVTELERHLRSVTLK
jgi:glycosyltransferase involved in cell wall biosynthesis